MTDKFKLELARYVNQKIFNEIWQEPREEYRHNMILTSMSNRPVIGTLALEYNQYVKLPVSRTLCRAFRVGRALFAGLAMDFKNWVNLEDYINSNPVDIRITGETGEWIHRKYVWLINDPSSDRIIVVIEQHIVSTILGYDYTGDFIISPYYDSTPSTQKKITSYKILQSSDIAYAYGMIQGPPYQINNNSLVFINGRFCNNLELTDLSIGDYIEIIEDDDVCYVFTEDIALDDPNRVFISEIDNRERHIIKIPKSSGLNNYIITHNTMDLYVSPRNSSGRRREGLFLHRAQGEGNSLESVMSNAFSIPHYLLVSYMSTLGVDEVTLTIRVRKQNSDNVVPIFDTDYTKYLLCLNDDTTMDFLEGMMSETVDCWNAKHLEKSAYVQSFKDMPDEITVDSFEYFLDVYGYYNLIGLICPRVYHFSVGGPSPSVVMTLPKLMSRDTDIEPLVAVNGKYLEYFEYGISRNANTLSISINDVPDEAYDLDVELFEHMKYPRPTKFIASSSSHSITVPFPNVHLEMYIGAGSNRELDPEFMSHLQVIHNDDDTTTIRVDVINYGRELYIFPSMQVHRESFDIQHMVDEGVALRANIKILLDDGDTVIPEKFSNHIVLLNGNRLVENVDYFVYVGGPLFNDGYIVEEDLNYYIVVTNKSYLETEGNRLEVLLTRDVKIHTTFGFVDSGNNEIPFWVSGLSNIHINGKVMNGLRFDTMDTRFLTSTLYPHLESGQIYEVNTVIPSGAIELLSKYTDGSNAYHKYIQIRDYFKSLEDYTDDIIVIPEEHHLYSPMLATIIYRVSKGTMHINYDPVYENMLSQVREYLNLKLVDSALSLDNDYDFIDTYPHYDILTFDTIIRYRSMRQLFKAIITEDTVNDGQYWNA